VIYIEFGNGSCYGPFDTLDQAERYLRERHPRESASICQLVLVRPSMTSQYLPLEERG